MRELTEQESKLLFNTLMKADKSNFAKACFSAGLDYQQAEVERLRAALAEAEQDAALLSKALKDLASELTKSNAGR